MEEQKPVALGAPRPIEVILNDSTKTAPEIERELRESHGLEAEVIEREHPATSDKVTRRIEAIGGNRDQRRRATKKLRKRGPGFTRAKRED